MNYNTFKKNEFYLNNLHKNNLIFFKEKNESQNSLFSSLSNPKEKIRHLKYKYNILNNNIKNPQLIHRKVQLLKNKYMKNNAKEEKKLQINSVIQYSINNNNMNNKTKFILGNNNQKNMFRSASLKLIKENNFKFNNLYSSFKYPKKSFFSENNNKENDNMQSKNELNNITTFHKTNNNKNGYHFKYLKNVKDDFINVHNKLKELWQNDAFNKKKKKKFNIIFPISKKIFLLSEMKKDIQNANKHSFSNSIISRNSESSKKNIFGELFYESSKETINSFESGIRRPNLIRSFSKPKLNVPKFSNLFNINN